MRNPSWPERNLQALWRRVSLLAMRSSPVKGRFRSLTGYKPIRVGIRALLIAVSHKPVVILYHASKSYMSAGAEIFLGVDCKKDSPLNHAGLVVAYDIEGPDMYLTLQNSWGSVDWGEDGYVRFAIPSIARGAVGICRIGTSKVDSYPGFRPKYKTQSTRF